MLEHIYKLEEPTGGARSIDPARLIQDAGVMDAVARAQSRYLPWHEFKRKNWAPENKEDVWALIKILRQIDGQPTPILDETGTRYTFSPRANAEFLHEVDLELGGVFLGVQDFNQGVRRQIIRRNLIEESIASSQLEGANTSRQAAKKMLAEGRAPTDKSEQMIVNNHETMRWIEEELKNEPLTIDLLFEIHRKITDNTLDDDHQGRLRPTFDSKGNRLVIKPWDDRTISYVTPAKEFVESQLPALISFANDNLDNAFIHPLTKAIMIHFWIGLLHPFEDGNGRLARILFYWYMLRRKYWAFSYLSISERILKSPRQYAMAYIYSEQDGGDLNYFIHYNIVKIKLARKSFQEFIAAKIEENKKSSALIKRDHSLNQRQINLLQYLSKDEQRYTTLKEYNNVNDDISKVTASTDLKKLVERDFLKKVKSGRNVYYYPLPKLLNLLG